MYNYTTLRYITHFVNRYSKLDAFHCYEISSLFQTEGRNLCISRLDQHLAIFSTFEYEFRRQKN
jgi:hypothetical protein